MRRTGGSRSTVDGSGDGAVPSAPQRVRGAGPLCTSGPTAVPSTSLHTPADGRPRCPRAA
ncbi:hypothetical protein FTX61_00335 [Nitriliruptoraceae bacterium ZYF776]|nr:hypothetical protein [Profundirhabdus halotolerans]